MNIKELFQQALPKAMRQAFGIKPVNTKRRFGSEPTPAPDKNSAHLASVLTKKVDFRRKSAKGKRNSQTIPTQHERVVAGRKARNPHYGA